jgi:hypothetical protein
MNIPNTTQLLLKTAFSGLGMIALALVLRSQKKKNWKVFFLAGSSLIVIGIILVLFGPAPTE